MRRWVRRRRGAPDLGLGVAVDDRVPDLAQEIDLHAQVLDPLLCQLVSQLSQLDLRLAELVPLELLVALAVRDERQPQVSQPEQDDHEVVAELAHRTTTLPRSARGPP
jgi:hypothetical protein